LNNILEELKPETVMSVCYLFYSVLLSQLQNLYSNDWISVNWNCGLQK